MTEQYPEGKSIFVTVNNTVLCNRQACFPNCDHKEADTRMMLHVRDSLANGFQVIQIVTSDTDVLVILLGVFRRLQAELNFRDISVSKKLSKDRDVTASLKELTDRIGHQLCQAIPFLHALTGCDTTSDFKSIGKKEAYETLKMHNASVSAFVNVYNTPFQQITADSEIF